MLHITDGDSVIHSFREASLRGEYVSWIDALHEGPVPSGLHFEQLTEVRARAVADLGWDTFEAARAAFDQRNQALSRAEEHDEVVLWFEHDLFDQLQLLQALDWAGGRHFPAGKLSLICPGGYLGPLDGEQLLALLPSRKPVRPAELTLAEEAWAAFRAPTPEPLLELLRRPLSALPYLRSALERFLEEYPSTFNGLSRSAQQLLLTVAKGGRNRHDIFRIYQESEDAIFLGDTSAWLRLDALTSGPRPALRRVGNYEFEITPEGAVLLSGDADWVRLRGIDQWLGGVHLEGPEAEWRWNAGRRTLERQII